MRQKSSILVYALIIGLLFAGSNSCDKGEPKPEPKPEPEPKSLAQLTTTGVTQITQTSAISGGVITSNGGASVTARGVCWSKNQTPTTSDNKTQDGSDIGAFSSNVAGLDPNTTYYIRSYATNSVGTSYGSAVSFATLKAVELPVITTTEQTDVSGITQTTAVFAGKIAQDGGAAITARGVCWSTNATPTINDNKTVDGSGIGNFTSTITGLLPNTTYHVRVYATNSKGTSYGNVISLTTLKTVELPVITTTEQTDVTGITQTTAVFAGKIAQDGGAAITARGVCWSTKNPPTVEDNKTVDGSGAGNFTSTITGLLANTTYHVRVYATNSKGTSYGNVISFTTLPNLGANTFIDSRDNNVYKFVTIGNQVWMAENLKYLPKVVGPATFSSSSSYYYVYDYNGTIVADAKAQSKYITYGVLYNWPAAMDKAASSATNPSGIQGVCPLGWHLPSDAEWTQLTSYLGGESLAGSKLKETGTSHWNKDNVATNETKFTALPGGGRYSNGTFSSVGDYGCFWSSTAKSSGVAFDREMHWSSYVLRYDQYLQNGYSVRCIKD